MSFTAVLSWANFGSCRDKEQDEVSSCHQNEMISWLRAFFPTTLVYRPSNRGCACGTPRHRGSRQLHSRNVKVCVQNSCNLAAHFADLKETGRPLLLLLLREMTREQLLLGWEVELQSLTSSFQSSLCSSLSTVGSSRAVGQSGPFIYRAPRSSLVFAAERIWCLCHSCHRAGSRALWPASFPPVYFT